jgi:sugar (pentulose or hexulose) kinase
MGQLGPQLRAVLRRGAFPWTGGGMIEQADILIAIDAGTSVIKAVAFTLAGDQIAIAARPNSYDTPGPGQVEQDMPRTWADCAATLRELQERVNRR